MSSNLAYQEERREELIGGKVVAMAPAGTTHNLTVGNILMIFRNYLRGKSCVPFSGGLSVYLTEKDRFLPDFMVICDRSKIKQDGVHGAPDLVVEVLSPSTAKYDRTHKKDVYERSGVQEYWLVSPSERSVEVYWLEDGRFVLNDVYTQRPDWELAQMKEEERAALVTEFKCRLYDDLTIRLDDIFSDCYFD